MVAEVLEVLSEAFAELNLVIDDKYFFVHEIPSEAPGFAGTLD
jgi:hypothetical protein